MPNERTADTGHHNGWVIATCTALVLAAVGDAGPEIVASRSLTAGYDGPGPLIYLGVAVLVAALRWRFVPLAAVVMSAFFLFGGFADADFVDRLTAGSGAGFVAAWLQMLSFAAAIVCGTAAIRRRQ
ncbi:hypothetical protein [Actinoplanes regularis]|uniref:hypothetical protein n=1 Tax=Actinoplanes regularis TaxID=52697 RepID=UPI0024A0B47B|nr:hypothetical protein [Actinoplanes regularis]GLW33588.1 hypothetical protein Areg01_65260 [Actinoplanes regularis]